MKTLYFYGDSNTYGFDPADCFMGRYPEKDIWTTKVMASLKDQMTFTFDGMNGRCIPTASWEVERVSKAIQGMDIFAVMLGTNDYLNYPEADAIADKMRRFLQCIDCSKVLLVAPVAIIIPGEADFNTEDGRLSRAFAHVARDVGCRFIDALQWNCGLAYDGVHLSAEGHNTFAERMTDYLSV